LIFKGLPFDISQKIEIFLAVSWCYRGSINCNISTRTKLVAKFVTNMHMHTYASLIRQKRIIR
jgi:hypothetical protein